MTEIEGIEDVHPRERITSAHENAQSEALRDLNAENISQESEITAIEGKNADQDAADGAFDGRMDDAEAAIEDDETRISQAESDIDAIPEAINEATSGAALVVTMTNHFEEADAAAKAAAQGLLAELFNASAGAATVDVGPLLAWMTAHNTVSPPTPLTPMAFQRLVDPQGIINAANGLPSSTVDPPTQITASSIYLTTEGDTEFNINHVLAPLFDNSNKSTTVFQFSTVNLYMEEDPTKTPGEYITSVQGTLKTPVAKSALYTLDALDDGGYHVCTGTFTVTVPDTENPTTGLPVGWSIYLNNAGSGLITVSGTDLMDGLTSFTLAQYDTVRLVKSAADTLDVIAGSSNKPSVAPTAGDYTVTTADNGRTLDISPATGSSLGVTVYDANVQDLKYRASDNTMWILTDAKVYKLNGTTGATIASYAIANGGCNKLALGNSDKIYVSTTYNASNGNGARFYEIDSAGTITSRSMGGQYTRGIAVDNTANTTYIMFETFGSSMLARWTQGGSSSTAPTSANTNMGAGLANSVIIDANGYPWVSFGTSSGSVLKQFSNTFASESTLTVLQTVSVQNYPRGMYIDASGYLWVCCYGSSSIQKINTTTGVVVQTWVASDATAAVGVAFSGPIAITGDVNGNIWIASYSNAKIFRINNLGVIDKGDAVPSAANPIGIAIDNDLNVWTGQLSTNVVTRNIYNATANVTFPASLPTNFITTIKHAGIGIINIYPTSPETLDLATIVTLGTGGDSVTLKKHPSAARLDIINLSRVATRDDPGDLQVGSNLTLNSGVVSMSSTNVTNALGYTPISNGLTSAYLYVGNASNVAAAVTLSGDVTMNSAGVTAVGANKVTLAMMAQMATASLLGRNTAGTGNAEVLGASTVRAILEIGLGGTTAARPASPYNYQPYFDTDLTKPIWWSGSAWIDATGATV